MIRGIFRSLPSNLAASFRGGMLIWHALAITSTYLLVVSGFDWWFFEATRNPFWHWLIMAAGISGFFVPVLVPVGVYIAGEVTRNGNLMKGGVALAQAAIIAWLVTSLYKAFTGRVAPEFLTYTSTIDTSREFHFGLLQNGIFWGWPSSHAAIAFAITAALWTLYPRNSKSTIGRYIALLYAFFIAFGAAIGFHWFSDVTAGAILGWTIGIVVGRSFRVTLEVEA